MIMITREELIADPDSWLSTKDVNLDFFDHISKEISDMFYLRKHGSEEVFFGIYMPVNKSFRCNKIKCWDSFDVKRDEISHFISLPKLEFQLDKLVE